jgi:hypothetical protein
MKTSQILISKISMFFNRNTDYLKLSNFYNSQSTKYASCLDDSSIFVKITDKSKIISLGFDCRVKTVLFLQRQNPVVTTILNDLTIKRNVENQQRIESVEKFNQMKISAKQIIAENPELFKKYWGKSLEKYQRKCSKQEQYVAWKLSTKFPEVSKTAFFHAI